MKIACPSCSAEYNIEDARVPAGGLSMKCPRCTTSFSVRKDGSVALAGGAAPLPPGPPPGARSPMAGPPPGARAPMAGPPPGARGTMPPRAAVPLPAASSPPPPPPPAAAEGDFTTFDTSMFDAPPPDFETVDMIDEGSGAPPPAEGGFDFGSLELDTQASPALHASAPPPPLPQTAHAGMPPPDLMEFDPSRSVSREKAHVGAPVMPMGGSVDDNDLELLDFIDAAAPHGIPEPAPDERFQVRRKTGKVFGPFEAALVVKMLTDGQLLGNEDVSTTGEEWTPIGSLPVFASAIQKVMDAPAAPGGKTRSDPKVPFGARMAQVTVVDPADLDSGPIDDRPFWKRHLVTAAIAAGLVVILSVGGALEVATPYGFWFRRSIFGLGQAAAGSPAAKLIDEVNQNLQRDTYASLQTALSKAESALHTSPKAPYLQALWSEVVFRVQARCGGQDASLAKARSYLVPLQKVDAKDPGVVRALGAQQFLDGKPDERTLLTQQAQKRPQDPEPLVLLARLALASKTPLEAAPFIDKLLSVQPRSARALHLKGELAVARGDVPGATAAFAEALAADPGHVASGVEVADLALTHDDLPRAEQALAPVLTPEAKGELGPSELARALAYQAEVRNLRGDPAAARPLFEEALKNDPDSVVARRYFGRFLLDQNLLDDCLKVLAPAREKAPDDVDIAMTRALALARSGKLLEANNSVDELKKKLPNDARLPYLQGLVFHENEKQDEAEKAMNAAATMDAKYAAPLVALAHWATDAGKLEDAQKDLEQALARTPDDAEVHEGVGYLKLRSGDNDGALAEFDKALAMQPGYAAAHHGKALALAAKKDVEGARKSFEAALVTGSSDPRIRMDYGSLLLDQGDLQGAYTQLLEARRLDPKNPKIHSKLGAAEFRLGKIDDSIVDVQTALSLDTKNAETFLYQALLFQAKGELPRAIEAGRMAVQLGPKDPRLVYQLGLFYEAQNNPVDSLENFQKASNLDPTFADALEHAGRAQVTLSATGEAIKSYEAAYAADPTRTRLLLAIGEAYLRARDFNKALARLQAAVKADPNLVGAYFRIGQAWEEKGNKVKAIQNYQLAVTKDPESPLPYRYLGYAFKDKNHGLEAISWFKKYLEKSPKADDRAEIEDEIASLGN